MKWVLIVVGALAGILLLLFVIGLLRPKEHTATWAVTIPAGDSVVWAVMTDFERVPAWNPDVKSVQRVADVDGRPAYKEDYGGGWSVTNVVRESVERRRLVREILPGGGFSGTWTHELAPDGAGTRLTITEVGRVDNPLFRAMMLFMDSRRTMRRYGEALARKVAA